MATQPIGDRHGRFVSVEEYLSTGYEPDCEYEDGMVVERNLGEFEHSFLQTILATLFTINMDAWGALVWRSSVYRSGLGSSSCPTYAFCAWALKRGTFCRSRR